MLTESKVEMSLVLAIGFVVALSPLACREEEPGGPEQGGVRATQRAVSDTQVVVGTISEMSASRLVLAHTLEEGEKVESSFVIDAATVTEGKLESGASARVRYREEDGGKTAVMVMAVSSVSEP